MGPLAADETLSPGARARSSGPLDDVLQALRARFGDRVTTNESVRQSHSATLAWLPQQPPDAVVFPQTAAEAQEIVSLCAARRIPIIPFGAGSSLEGQVNAPRGGVCLSLRQMNRIVSIQPENMLCRVEPGVTREQLNAHLRGTGLHFPIDPGADATLGGMASTRASGTTAVRYGTMKENVLGLSAVLADGEEIRAGSRARKNAAGYDLTSLFVGAEGTLGIITELTLRLHPLPETIVAGVCHFATIASACEATILAMQSGLPMARIEFLDALQARACNAYSQLDLPETPMLLVEFHGAASAVAEQRALFETIVGDCGGFGFKIAEKPEDRTRLWTARHNCYWASRALRPAAQAVSSDVCVPIAHLAQCVVETQQDLAQTGLLGPIAGHVGDGNFHVLLLVDADDRREMRAASDFLERLVPRALKLGGSCSGEHGIGQAKMKYLDLQYGEVSRRAMAAVKRGLDPHGIMNPGKIFTLDGA